MKNCKKETLGDVFEKTPPNVSYLLQSVVLPYTDNGFHRTDLFGNALKLCEVCAAHDDFENAAFIGIDAFNLIYTESTNLSAALFVGSSVILFVCHGLNLLFYTVSVNSGDLSEGEIILGNFFEIAFVGGGI